MSDNILSDDLCQLLNAIADQMNSICVPDEHVSVNYDIMSGALIWSDEIPPDLWVGKIWVPRFIFAYRTSLMLGEPRIELQPVWDEALALFPKWIGFLPERREPTPDLLEVYRRGDVSLHGACVKWREKWRVRRRAKIDALLETGEQRQGECFLWQRNRSPAKP